jgi:hypothetical protein
VRSHSCRHVLPDPSVEDIREWATIYKATGNTHNFLGELCDNVA